MILNKITDTTINLKDLDQSKTALIVIDMVNGFVKEGVFASSRVYDLIPEIVSIVENLPQSNKIFFLDSHTKDSKEFDSYPIHCLEGTNEELLIDELDNLIDSNSLKIKKNSTNGAIEDLFLKWLDKNSHIENFIITGCITEVCVMQFALTLKGLLNKDNKNGRLIVPINAVDTFHSPEHDATIINYFALSNMKQNGIEVIAKLIK